MSDGLTFGLGLGGAPKWKWIVRYHSVHGSIEHFLCIHNVVYLGVVQAQLRPAA